MNYKVEWIDENEIAQILKHPNKSVKDKFILLIHVKDGRIPELSKYALQKLGLEGRTLCILTTEDGTVQQYKTLFL